LRKGPRARWVKVGRTQSAQMSSGLPLRADIVRCGAAGQPGILRPGLSCFATSTRTGYANRPNTGN
jgi:hypothetical protein